MNKVTIKDAIKKVLKESNDGLTAKEIYEKIIANNLFIFKAKSPVSVLSAELRKSCSGVNVKKGRHEKIFSLKDGNRYVLSK